MLKVGAALAKRAARAWLSNRTSADRREMELAELIAYRYPVLRHQREFRRKVEEIEDQVADRLQPLCENEFPELAGNEREAATLAVADALERADLTDAVIFRVDLNPIGLAREIREHTPQTVRNGDLSEPAGQLFELLLDQVCYYLAHLIRDLPEFDARASVEMLSRLSSIAGQLGEVLDRLPVTELRASTEEDQDEEFRDQYFELASNLYDRLDILGITTNYYEPTITLTVAYLSLTASAATAGHKSRQTAEKAETPVGAAPEERPQDVVRVENALGGKRLILIQGDAGAGKSTLLQWIAITAVRRRFVGRLSDWNGRVPFLIRLRDFSENRLPSGDEFLLHANAPQWGPVPEGWVDRVAEAGRALFLIDGVDELPEQERAKVREWLRGLNVRFPECLVVVTSRPSEGTQQWLVADKFHPVTLEPMNPQDVRIFIERWHNALLDSTAGLEIALPCPREDVPGHQRSLLVHLDSRPHLRALARNPLLCAMICALNLDRRANLPRDRMTLYEAALDMLLERRDADKRVPVGGGAQLSAVEKRALLRALAWWLNENGRAEMSREEAIHQLRLKIASMPGVTQKPEEVLLHLLERSGLVRQPVIGRIDFVHRTFQEFLAAKEVVERDSIDLLINNASSDLWRETVLMACSHASVVQRDRLLNGIVDKAFALHHREGAPSKHRLMLLAASCLESALELSSGTIRRVEACLHELVPPTSMDEVSALATVGRPLFRVLPRDLGNLPEKHAVLLVRTVALSNEVDVLRVLAQYARDQRWGIQEEIVACARYFDLGDYCDRVLRDAPLFDNTMEIRSADWIEHLGKLRKLTSVEIKIYPEKIDDLNAFRNIHALRGLLVHVAGHCDITPLGALRSRLGYLNLTCDGKFVGLEHLSDLRLLRELALAPAEGLDDLGFIGIALGGLTRLDLSGIESGTDLSVLGNLVELRRLGLRGCRERIDLSLLDGLAKLERVDLRDAFPGLDLGPLAHRHLRVVLDRDHQCTGVESLGPQVDLQFF
ncbi:NACHT domain-containing protein [Amycolatopsis sp. SID8362]|uniref:NACHT domain-containing protein n=1 Tax=Amycolatopsis sp. SID8362 TaxID=2690346 RepID=UPI00136BABE0|nr:NACHT domain-containing protein [Amycolatopsis sp. SID8362]NBH06890.1 NACHT domain-containing protein [Amycolatopsis sp. SID8362]NED43587.1 NACHT domain-containing protein [Amycolatopsis sp. SID8362]